MGRFFRVTEHMIQRLSELGRQRRVRARALRAVAAILLAAATVVVIARHDAIGLVLQPELAAKKIQPPTTASQAAEAPPAAPVRAGDAAETTNVETRLAYTSGRIETSLFEDGHQAGLSDALILKLVEIFGWDIDFALGVKPGDTFAVIHEEKYWMGQKLGDGQILAAEFVNRGVPNYAFAFPGEKGDTVYYDKDGMTKKKLFLRTPIEFSRVSSGYTDRATRFHPILKIWTAHRGVDYAAPAGTPIKATAAGQIVAIGPDGGYGNRIIVKHWNGPYTTLYAHMSRFAENPSNPKDRTFRPGSPVEQGQIIGYVGQTGLATGPHLHYEFQINGGHKDPRGMKFPGTPIPERDRQAFFAKAQPLIAQLIMIADRHVATTR